MYQVTWLMVTIRLVRLSQMHLVIAPLKATQAVWIPLPRVSQWMRRITAVMRRHRLREQRALRLWGRR